MEWAASWSEAFDCGWRYSLRVAASFASRAVLPFSSSASILRLSEEAMRFVCVFVEGQRNGG